MTGILMNPWSMITDWKKTRPFLEKGVVHVYPRLRCC